MTPQTIQQILYKNTRLLNNGEWHFTKDTILEAMRQWSDQENIQLKERVDELESTLGLLLYLKEEKDSYGKTDWYVKHQPKAWEAAKKLVKPNAPTNT